MSFLTRKFLPNVALAALLCVALATLEAQASRDSGGVRIVENPSRKSASVVYRLSERPLFEVGGTEANLDEEFDNRQGYLRAVHLSNGGIAVIDVSRVHYFDSTGKRIRIVGRKGQGPDEFMYLTAICRTRADTVVVSDLQTRRLSVIAPSGVIVRTIAHAEFGSAPFNFCLTDGTLLLTRTTGAMAGNGRLANKVTRLRTDGAVVNVVGEFETRPYDIITQAETAINAAQEAVYYGDPFGGEIRELNPSGGLRRIIRSADPSERITNAEIEEKLARTVPVNVTGSERTARLEELRARPHSLDWPRFARLEISNDGTIWVQDYRRAPATPDAWVAFDSSGRLLGKLLIPVVNTRGPRIEILGFLRDRVLLKRWDNDGAAHVAVFAIRR